ncbi:uncharacterized protein LOC135815516 [Sycon ciliatum]|uniref:uncharacterized protein LOC135815516 n=1 Tax=Sycon ciliatum TaxID=27933 RepID=UPI0031F635D0
MASCNSTPRPSHHILLQAILVNWDRLVRGLDCIPIIDKLINRQVVKLNSLDSEMLGPRSNKRNCGFTLSHMLLERLIAMKDKPLGPDKEHSALQEFFAVLLEAGWQRAGQMDLATLILDSAADPGALQREYDALSRGSINFMTLSDRELAELPSLYHLQLAAMPDSVKKLRRHLQERYRVGNFVPFGACGSDYGLLANDAVGDHISYIPISLLPLAGKQALDSLDNQPITRLGRDRAHDEESRVDLQDIFTGGDGQPLRTKCLLIGPPGAGKTMTSLEILRRWGCCDMFTEYSLALYVAARRLREDMTFWDVLGLGAAAYGLSAADMAEVRDYATQHSKQILVVMDGLDELRPSLIGEESAVLRVLAGTGELSACHVVATSRPCAQARRLLSNTAMHYQMCELSSQQQTAMLRRRIQQRGIGGKKADELAAKFERERESLQQVELLMANPLHASLIITQFLRDGKLPSGLCEVYGHVVISLLKRYVTRKTSEAHQSQDEDITQTYGLGPSVEKVVKKQDSIRDGRVTYLVEVLSYLEKLALDGILDQQYLFEVMYLDSKALDTGLLVHWDALEMSKTDKLGVYCQYIHLAVQEFMAARWIAQQPDCRQLIQAHMNNKIPFDEGKFNFWLCLAGLLDGESLCFLLRHAFHIAEKGVFEHRKMAARLLLHSMAQFHDETQSCWRVQPTSTQNKVPDVRLADVLEDGNLDLGHHQLNDQDFNILIRQLQHDMTFHTLSLESCLLDESRCEKLSRCDNLGQLDTLHIGVNKNISREGLPLLLRPLSDVLCSLRRLSIRSCGLQESDLKAICDFLKSTESLDELYLHKTVPKLSTEGCAVLAAAVRQNKSLTRLVCSCMDIEDAGAEELALAAIEQGKIDQILLRENQIGDVGAKACIRAVSVLACHRLDLSFNCLTDSILPHLQNAVEQLQRRSLFEAPGDGGSGDSVNYVLKLAGNQLTRHALEALGRTVQSPYITLQFGYASICGGGMRELSPESIDEDRYLPPHGKYSQLNLTFMGIGDEYIGRLEKHLSSLTGYESLSCGQNRLTSVGMVPLANVLCFNRSIQALDLSSNQIDADGLATIVSAVEANGPNRTLRYLSLQGNPLATAGMGDGQWQRLEHTLRRLISRCPNLELIGLHSTGIGDRGVAVLAKYFPRRSSLRWLSLAQNGLTDTGIKYLCERLATDRTLRILDLSFNRLRDTVDLNKMQAQRLTSGARHIDPICLDGNEFSDKVVLGTGLLRGRLYFQYSTTILSLLDSLKAARDD